MDIELKQRASESADRLARAGMTMSAGIMQELLAAAEELLEQNTADTEYIRFLETELTHVQLGNNAVPEPAPELGEENPQLRELRRNQMVLAGEMNN